MADDEHLADEERFKDEDLESQEVKNWELLPGLWAWVGFHPEGCGDVKGCMVEKIAFIKVNHDE